MNQYIIEKLGRDGAEKLIEAWPYFDEYGRMKVGFFQFRVKKILKEGGYQKGIDYVIVIRGHIVKKVFDWILANWDVVIPIIKEFKSANLSPES